MGKGFQHHIWAEYVYEQNTSGEVGCVQWICLARSHAIVAIIVKKVLTSKQLRMY